MRRGILFIGIRSCDSPDSRWPFPSSHLSNSGGAKQQLRVGHQFLFLRGHTGGIRCTSFQWVSRQTAPIRRNRWRRRLVGGHHWDCYQFDHPAGVGQGGQGSFGDSPSHQASGEMVEGVHSPFPLPWSFRPCSAWRDRPLSYPKAVHAPLQAAASRIQSVGIPFLH